MGILEVVFSIWETIVGFVSVMKKVDSIPRLNNITDPIIPRSLKIIRKNQANMAIPMALDIFFVNTEINIPILSTEEARIRVIKRFKRYFPMSDEPDLKKIAIPPSANPIDIVNIKEERIPVYLCQAPEVRSTYKVRLFHCYIL